MLHLYNKKDKIKIALHLHKEKYLKGTREMGMKELGIWQWVIMRHLRKWL